ncbi:hypothetical protein M8312_11580 [Sphingomonas sp. KRR8]|jgi:hypothetical protein|uniref:hypothetical protein n=1 Tax=Sphingomonas sp. KRR8 TaxID=2942996 RepID=UPI0020208C08|nr:hypothetical protein [Sphingomonas sp. KRR8]URD60416.1 hypothetical protein M8312_11580 [Sphingomonas sp. KRR8]
MSRALFVNLSEDQVIAKCAAEQVGISALEKLPDGGVRVVCMSSDGAATMTRKFKSSLISGTTRREPFRPAYSRA